MGLIAENGDHVEQDYKTAAVWYRRAADQGFVPAWTYLGGLAGMGRGDPKNYSVAERLFREAAEAGHRPAAMDLLDLKVCMGEPSDPRGWATVLQDAARDPLGLPMPDMPPVQGMPDMQWLRALGVQPSG